MDLDRELFDIKEQGGLRLIVPSLAVGNAPWTKETIQFRSRVEDIEGRVVSQGFKKFFNLSTGPEGLNIGVEDVVKNIGKGAIATLKLDGSLLIRSVWRGRVLLRTRGSFGYQHLDNAHEMEIFYDEYQEFFDPLWYWRYSLLFEWCSPNNVIVIKYPKPSITLVGGIDHNTMRYIPMEGLKIIAKDLRLPVVDHFPLTHDGWARLQDELETDQTIEGYVIRLNQEQDLVKVKCAPYLTKHGLKSSLTSEKLADMWFQQDQPPFELFCENFTKAFDEETFMWAIGAISNLYDGVKRYRGILAHMLMKAEERKGLSRKEAALAGIAEYGQTKRFGAYMRLWEGKTIPTDLSKSILLQSSKQVEISMFKATGSTSTPVLTDADIQFEKEIHKRVPHKHGGITAWDDCDICGHSGFVDWHTDNFADIGEGP